MTSYKAGNSIRANAANSQQGAPILKVKNNKIDYFIGEAIYMGIRKPATIDIQNNQIFDNNEAIGPFFRFGIVIDNTGNAEIHLKGSLIKNNEIRSRSILQGGYFVGIVLRKSSYLTIEQNQVLEVLPQSNLGVFHGILTNEFPCNGLRLYSNTINGATINYVGPSAGIYIRESVNCIVNCNQTDNVNIGALFLGMCDNADVSKNRFNYHGIGLGLGAPQLPTTTSIGPQSKKENRWFGTNSPIEAYALNPATAMDSKFEINSSDLNSDYWPLPRKIGSTNDNFVWFTQLIGQEPSNNFTCFTGKTFGEGVLAGSDIRLLNGNYSSPLNYPALTWEAKWQFADRLNRNPSLQTINGMAAQYYQNTYNDNYSRLNRAYQSYINRWQPDATIESQTASLVTAIEQRFALDFTLSLNFDDNSALHSQMLTSDADITDKTASLKSTFENWIPTVNQSVNTLIAEVNSVTCAQEYESDMKSLLIVMLQSHFTGGELSAQQTATISQIANKCRYSAGYAVVLARGFFEQQESYAQDEYCQTGERSDIPTANISDAVTLYPNPASQSFLLGMGLPAVQGQLQMFNSQGKMVRSIGLSDAATFVSVSDLPEGVYYINIRLDSSETAHKIFVKIK
jgi:hypothetical protein